MRNLYPRVGAYLLAVLPDEDHRIDYLGGVFFYILGILLTSLIAFPVCLLLDMLENRRLSRLQSDLEKIKERR